MTVRVSPTAIITTRLALPFEDTRAPSCGRFPSAASCFDCFGASRTFFQPCRVRYLTSSWSACSDARSVTSTNRSTEPSAPPFSFGDSMAGSNPRSVIARARTSHSCRASSDARVGLMITSGIKRRLSCKSRAHEALRALRNFARWSTARRPLRAAARRAPLPRRGRRRPGQVGLTSKRNALGD